MFNEMDVKALTKMGLDLINGKRMSEKDSLHLTKIEGKFSLEEGNDIFNKKFIKTICENAGLAYNDGKLDYYTFSSPSFQHGLFNLIGITMEAILPKVLTNQFDALTTVRNAAWGDKLVIEVTSPDYFAVSKVSNGTTNLRRQRLDRRSIELNPVMRGVKVSESLFRVLSGKSDWATFINKAAISLATAIKADVYNGIYDSYSLLDATYGVTGAFSGDALVTMAEHVKAACGGLQPIIMGTTLALSKVLPATGIAGMTSYNMMDAYNDSGYLGKFRSYNCFSLEQAHVPSTDTFAINNNFLIVVPMGANKIANLGFEGEMIVQVSTPETMASMEMEYTILKAWDTQILSAGKYGIYRLV